MAWLGLLTALLLAVTREAAGAPYPPDGLLIEWTQPNGKEVTLRIFGDEFYAYTTTKDGYTVVLNETDKTYYYAMRDADSGALVASDVRADELAPDGVPKALQESAVVVRDIREKNLNLYDAERAAEWSKREKAYEARLARLTAGLPSTKSSDAAEAAANAVTGAKVGLTILVQFPDDTNTTAADPVNFPSTQAKITRYCNEVGYTDDGNTGSVKDYFFDQSNGQLTFTHVVTAVVTMPKPRNYYNYSDWPTNSTVRSSSGDTGRLLVTDAVNKLKTDGFDFSTLTVDASNRAVSTSLLFAGPSSGTWAKGLWPHAWSLASSGINVGTTANPRYIYRYQATNVENASPVIGTFIHELGHLLLSYPDLYDTDSSDGDSAGVGEHCLMGSGNHLNSGKTPAPIDLYLKELAGWATITDITAAQSITVALPTTGNRGHRIRKSGSTTEYFLFENRGPGDKWAANCKDTGIAIWHIDTAVTTDNKRQQRTSSQHYKVSIQQADGLFHLEQNTNRGDAADFFDTGKPTFTDTSSPDAKWWDGTTSGILVDVQSAPGASMNVRFGPVVAPSTLTVNPTSQSVAAGGASPTFDVTSNTTWSWTDDATWVTSSEAASQTGNQVFGYTVAANTGTANRSATITLTGGGLTRTHSITQAGTVADDHGNSTGTATVVALSSTTAGVIGTTADEDFFRINVSGTGSLVVETTGTTDTFGHLLGSTGTELATDDDQGADQNFRISSNVTTGTYYVRVRHSDNTQTGAYQLVCSFSASPTLTVSAATQSVVAGGASHSFDVTSNTSWSWTNNAPAWVTTNEITPQSGNQTFTYNVAANTTASNRVAVITLTAGALTRTHTITQAAGSLDDHGNSTGAATLVTTGSTTNGNIETAGDNDYFRIVIPSSGTLLVNTTGNTDTYGYLLDSGGAQLTYDDDSGVSTNFQISRSVTAATFYIRLTHYSSTGTGAYQLVCTFTPAATLAVSPTTQTVVGGGASHNFDVSSNSTWSWGVNQSWVTSSEAASQSGNQTFTYNVAANTGASSRTAIITLTAGALSATHTITQDPASQADLMDPGTYYSVSPTSVIPGGTIAVGGDVRNAGTAASGAYVVRFYLSANTTINTSDYFLGEKSMSALGAGSSGIIDQSGMTVPVSIPAGTYYAGWIYDAAGAVAESNEANNTGYVASPTVTVTGSTALDAITQTISDGSQSIWGDANNGNVNLNYMDDATLTTPLGASGDAFDGAGLITITPAVTLTPLTASAAAGPLASSGSTGTISLQRTVSFVAGRNATEELITVQNLSGSSQSVTLLVVDNYGSDTATAVHGTSSGDTTVTTADSWFVLSDQTTASATSGDPAIMVSWLFNGLPAPTFTNVPGGGLDNFSINFGTFSIAGSQSVTIRIRRELFDSASLALSGGQPLGAVDIITQSVSGTQSRWGDLYDSNLNYMSEAELTTSNGVSGDAFDGVGVLTLSPAITLPSLTATSAAGPLGSTGVSGNVRATRTIRLVSGRHATDEEIMLTNNGGSAQSVSLRVTDNYGSDGSTNVHGTSSGDVVVTTADTGFVISDQTSPSTLAGDPAVLVSWLFSAGLPAPSFPSVPATGSDGFAMDFGTFSLGAGQSVTVTIRRELFDTASLALLAAGWGVNPNAPEIAVEQPINSGMTDGSSRSFPLVSVGGSSSLTFTIRNTGPGNLTGISVGKDGVNEAEFSVNTDGMADTLATGATTNFSVTFTPSVPGTRTAALHIGSNDADENPFDIALTGTGGLPAQITSPADGAILPGTATTFNWNAGIGVTSYTLWIGSTYNGYDLYSGNEGTNLSRTLTMPGDGRALYATLWSLINGVFQPSRISCTAWSATSTTAKAQIISPLNGSTIATNQLQLFWNAGANVTSYALWVGTTPSASNIHSYQGTNLSRTVTVPVGVTKVYVTLWSLISGVYQANHYFFNAPAGTKAVIASPVDGSTLASGTLDLAWAGGTGVNNYALWIGSSPGGYDLGAFHVGTATTRSVTVPTDGGAVYVTLWSLISGAYQSSAHWYFTTATSNPRGARLTSPANASNLASATLDLAWEAGLGATNYALWIGSVANGYDLYAGIEGTVLAKSVVVPADGRRLHVTLHSLIGGAWQSNSYWFNAATLPDAGAAQITSPTPGSTLTSSTLPLVWSPAAGATNYHLYVGSSPNGYDLYNAGQGTSLSRTVTVPVDGRPVYVTLWSLIKGVYKSSSVFFIAANTATGNRKALINSHANGSTFTNANPVFAWTTGVGVTLMATWIGNSPLGYDIWASTESTSSTYRSTAVPTDGRKVHVTFWSLIGGVWQGASYIYTTVNIPLAKASLTSHVSGATFTSTTEYFTWDFGYASQSFQLHVGRSPGGADLFNGNNLALLQYTTVTGLPSDGSPVYVTLYTLLGGVWKSNEYIFNAWQSP